MKPPALCIDYGTSNTVAVLRRADGQVRPLLFDGSPLLPSGGYDRSGELVTGREAARLAVADPAGFEPHPKRRIDDGEVLLGTRSVPVAELIAATLAAVRREVVRVADGIPARAVLTHPAAWGGRRRAILLDAARRAGFHDPLLTPEPVAAARYFAAMPRTSVPPGGYVAVFDLGAGTFDVSLVRSTGTGFDVAATDGLDDFGGADLDELVIARLGETVRATDAAAWERLHRPADDTDRRGRFALRESARHAKEALSLRSSTEVHVPIAERRLHLTRAELDADAAVPVRRAVELVADTVLRAGITPAVLSGLFLVGGSTRMPLVATMLHRRLGIAPTVIDQPELVVAEGGLGTEPAFDLTPTTPSLAPLLKASEPDHVVFHPPPADADADVVLDEADEAEEEEWRRARRLADKRLPNVGGRGDSLDSRALVMVGVAVAVMLALFWAGELFNP